MLDGVGHSTPGRDPQARLPLPLHSGDAVDVVVLVCELLQVLGIIQSEFGTPEMEPVWIPSMTTELMSMVRLILRASIYGYRIDGSSLIPPTPPF